MKRPRNTNWIAAALVAACVLAVACFAALPNAGRFGIQPILSDQSIASDRAADFEQTVASAKPEQSTVDDQQTTDDPYGGLDYEHGIVLIALPPGISPSDAVSIIQQETGLEGLALADEADVNASAATAAEDELLVRLAVPDDMSIQDMVGLIGASSAVDAAQPNFFYELADNTDPETAARETLVAQNLNVQALTSQVNDSRVNDQWVLPSIYAYNDTTGLGNAWTKVTSDEKQGTGRVTVAVIDEGFQANHPDLSPNIVDMYNSATKKSGANEITEVYGERGHGTHVAGIISAAANNEEGVAGVSYNANLMLIKAYDEEDDYDPKTGLRKVRKFTTASLVEAFQHARGARYSSNVRVISMSVCGATRQTTGWTDDSVIKEIDKAHNLGIAVVCSAGNMDAYYSNSDGTTTLVDGPYLCYPSDYHNVVSVINLTRTNTSNPHSVVTASSSNYNASTPNGTVFSGKDISAPGTTILSTIPTSSYGTKEGTSMAAPVVASVLALVFTQQPSLTASQAESLLYSTTTDLGTEGWDLTTGYGEVNAYRAVTETDAYLTGTTTVQAGKQVTFTMPSNAAWSWDSDDTSIATVSGGVVTGVGEGSTRISAIRKIGNVWMRSFKNIAVYDPKFSGSNANSASVGSTTQQTLICNLSGSWKWISTETDVATVSSTGKTVTVNALKPGKTVLRAELLSNDNVYIEKEFTVTAANLSNATVTFSSATYNGLEQQLSPTVKIGTVTLSMPSDYKVVYPEGDYKNAGLKSVTIEAGTSGRTTGSKTASFTIDKKSASISAKSKTKTYDGTALTATAAGYSTNGFINDSDVDSVTLSGAITNVGSTTSRVSSYKLSSSASGNYDVTITGVGALTVNAADLSSTCVVSLSATSMIYTGNELKPTVTVKRGTTKLVEGADYTLLYCNNVQVGTNTASAKITGKGNYTGTGTSTFTIAKGALESFAGSNRYDTAKKIALAECALPGASYEGVIVCSCNEGKFPDALSAAGLSGVLGYPVVAVNGVGLEPTDREALAAMQSRCPSRSLNILVVGGEATVSAAVRAELSAYGRVSFPFAGADRYETNRLIYEYGAAHGGWSTSQAFIASGANFPDAMTIAPYLVWAKCPIVLVDPSASSLSPAQRSAVAGAAQVVALGGTTSVPERLLTQAASASARGSSLRLGGATRYETSAAIVEWELGCGMTLEGAGFATGQAFPDALASSFLLGSRGSVLGLVSPSGNNPDMLSAVSAAAARKGVPSTMRVFGGIASVPTSVRNQLAQAAGWPSWNAASN